MKEHFLLIKMPGRNADGLPRSGYQCAVSLLNAGMWPLWENTPCRLMIGAGHKVLVYIGGDELRGRHVVASATVESVVPWNRQEHYITRRYPLALDGIPEKVVNLTDCHIYQNPISLKSLIDKLSFMPANRKKWGSAVCGGARSLIESDYKLLAESTSG